MADCIECGAEVSLHDDLEVGEIVDCATCGAELEALHSMALMSTTTQVTQ